MIPVLINQDCLGFFNLLQLRKLIAEPRWEASIEKSALSNGRSLDIPKYKRDCIQPHDFPRALRWQDRTGAEICESAMIYNRSTSYTVIGKVLVQQIAFTKVFLTLAKLTVNFFQSFAHAVLRAMSDCLCAVHQQELTPPILATLRCVHPSWPQLQRQ
jgi:hypothetical protein